MNIHVIHPNVHHALQKMKRKSTRKLTKKKKEKRKKKRGEREISPGIGKRTEIDKIIEQLYK